MSSGRDNLTRRVSEGPLSSVSLLNVTNNRGRAAYLTWKLVPMVGSEALPPRTMR